LLSAFDLHHLVSQPGFFIAGFIVGGFLYILYVSGFILGFYFVMFSAIYY